MGFSDLIKYLNDKADKANQETINNSARIFQAAGSSPEEALKQSQLANQFAQNVGMTSGTIKVFKSPSSAGLEAARQAMSEPGSFQKLRDIFRSPEAAGIQKAKINMAEVNPEAQKQLVNQLSSITEEPLQFGFEKIRPRLRK